MLVLVVAYLAGWTESPAGWTPFIFLAVVLLGFCTWEGGLIGIQDPNHNFTRFEQALKDGKHVFFVDLEPGQEAILETVLKSPRASRGWPEPEHPRRTGCISLWQKSVWHGSPSALGPVAAALFQRIVRRIAGGAGPEEQRRA